MMLRSPSTNSNNFERTHPAVVLGLFDTGLAVVRGLARTGIQVIGLDSNQQQPGFKSRFCQPKLCPDPVFHPQELLDYLLEESIRLVRPAILYPASDAYVLFCSRQREQLNKSFLMTLPPTEIVEAFLNKRSQYELAEKLGTPYPTTYYPKDMNEVIRLKNRIEYPVMIKPCYSHLWSAHFNNKGFRIDSPDELIERYQSVFPLGLDVMLQTVIPGPCTNNLEVSFYVNQSGKALAFFCVRKIRQYPPQFGVGTMVETIHAPNMIDLALNFISNIGYRGFGNLEFKHDPRDGKLKLIELNLRLWQQCDQAEVCGINFPLLQYLDLTDQPLPVVPPYQAGIKWVNPIPDFQSFWYFYRRGELTARQWLDSWRGIQSFSVFTMDDPLPALASIDYGLKFLRLPLYLFRQFKDRHS
jgi:predicted ATP-grasp superfamily ATP-dependent carboligase